MRVGIVGSGFMGSVHASAWSKTPATLAGVASADIKSAEALASQFHARAYPSFEDMLEEVDVVDICTPTFLHHQMVLKAAQAKKHIVCEKPLALEPTSAWEMITAAQQMNVMLLVGHVVRFFPEYEAAKSIVSRNKIGKVAVVRLTRCSFKPARAQADSWFHDVSKSGGMMLDLMIHDFDYARWVAGDVVSVYARNVASRFVQAPADYALAILRHANGAVTHVEGGWVYPPPMFRTGFEIAGSEGLIEHPAGSSAPLAFYLHRAAEDDTSIAVPTSPLAEDPYTVQIRHFYNVLAGTEHEPRITAQDAFEALCIAKAAITSASRGEPVTIEEVKQGVAL
jgi:predicted dehydrogenase